MPFAQEPLTPPRLNDLRAEANDMIGSPGKYARQRGETILALLEERDRDKQRITALENWRSIWNDWMEAPLGQARAEIVRLTLEVTRLTVEAATNKTIGKP